MQKTIMKCKSKNIIWINKCMFCLTGFLMPSQILAYKIIPFFVIPMIIIIINNVLFGGRIIKSGIIYFLAIFTVINTLLMLTSSLPGGWKESSRNQVALFCVIIVFALFEIKGDEIRTLKKGIYAGLFVNVIWFFLQYSFYTLARMDLNDLVFNRILSIREEASTFNPYYGTICMTGLNWHPSQLVLA